MTGSDETDPFLGQVVMGRYLIKSLIARGGMGSVYTAYDQIRGRKVAVKLLELPRLKTEFARELRDRFVREANTIAKLEDPRTLKLFDFGEVESGLVMVTELLRGHTLAAAIKDERRIPPETLVPILIDITYCLAEAHAAGVVHRDIKPGNLFLHQNLAGDVTTKVLDFGIAKVTDDSLVADSKAAFSTQTGFTLGTVAYMSPEQAAADEIGPSSDLYSLGAVAYHALTGQVPFEGTISEVRRAHMTKNPKPFSARDLKLQSNWRGLEAVVLKCLSKAPKDRFENAQALRAMLERLRAQAAATDTYQTPSFRNPPFTRTAIQIAILSLLTGLVGGATYLLLTRCTPQPTFEGFVELPVCEDQALFAEAKEGNWIRLAVNLAQRAQDRPEYWLNSTLAWVRADGCQQAEKTWARYLSACPKPCPLGEQAASIQASIKSQCAAYLEVKVRASNGANDEPKKLIESDIVVRGLEASIHRMPKDGKPLELKPGRYEVQVRSPGYISDVRTLVIARGEHRTMEFDLRVDEPSPSPTAEPRSNVSSPQRREKPRVPQKHKPETPPHPATKDVDSPTDDPPLGLVPVPFKN